MQVVIFKLNEEQFAVETSKVKSINDSMKITKVPKAPAYIKGIINLRGNVISILDINLLMDVPKQKDNKESENSIIILEMEDELVGIVVDQVDEVMDLDEKVIEKVNDENKKNYIEGVINFKDRVVTLIDIDKLFSN
ncbi:purine-binding chemotaxis protein CheW [Clostridium sp. cel8]|jgi:purine-binding chemotaxis protein CheW|uniref:chemotaxis protein CheW n=1 Tax=unclassified Clostridium TaxID=2614128 RepID=UPI0015F45DEB|nr:chemotaxis protein CheW [Clostridium sp. cel8]MBA5851091.1 purine-binding chemotaxis protein CheW [Clostridium sp. cel8]